MSWTNYEAEGDNYIEIDRWGKDHWSTLAYIECRVIDNSGTINNLQMRCDSRLHRHFAHVQITGMTDRSKYPTRLQGGEELENHDDWSCLEDMVASELVIAEFRDNPKMQGEVFGHMEAKVKLTELGTQVSGILRAYKANGGVFAKFQLWGYELEILSNALNGNQITVSHNRRI